MVGIWEKFDFSITYLPFAYVYYDRGEIYMEKGVTLLVNSNKVALAHFIKTGLKTGIYLDLSLKKIKEALKISLRG